MSALRSILHREFVGCVITAASLVAGTSALAADNAATGTSVTFEKDVVPVLKAHCFRCHGDEKREAELDLRRRFTILQGGDSGAAILSGKPKKSLLIEMIEDELMPPEGEPRLRDEEIDVLRRWIATGAAIAGKVEPPLAATESAGLAFDESARQHWAFQPVRKVTPPTVTNPAWLETPVDAFTLADLERRNWQPAPPATRTELIRRVYFDLIGLPPTPEEIAAFVSDESHNAYAKLVDRLLASPHYGERWAQHWLDVVRFAETEGFEYDRHLPDAWRFRDYVIDSLNADKPFDRFVTEQIAGDEIEPDDQQHQAAAIFHRLGAVRRNAGNPDIALSRNEVLTERTNIVGEAFLGLTVGCARCHNHKLEPITQKDYYRLQAYLAATEEHNVLLATLEEKQAWDKQSADINAEIKKLKTQATAATGDKKIALQHQITELAYTVTPHPPTIPSIRNDFENRTAIHVLRRGVWEHKGVAVGPRPLSVLVSLSEPELSGDVARPRTELARWITNDRHPLTARVIVNRLWQHHFGTGLVKTANDFGTHGERPSHPELLDWLAQTLVDNGWRWKAIHRHIVLSNTYRQSSNVAPSAEIAEADPENRFHWRFNRRRLSAEEIRDALLAVSGRINLRAHGPSVMVPVDRELINLLYKPTQWRVADNEATHRRRSVYLIAKRNLRLPFMESFDAPALQSSCPSRETSTHAPQALELLNGKFSNELAAAYARRLARECDDQPERMIERGFQLAVGRSPTERERALSIKFLRDQPLDEFALALFNLNGFVYVK
jgi:cytochrome c553